MKPGYDQQYFEFMIREWVPGITQMGLQPRESWYTMYGECPQMLTSTTTNDLESMRAILNSDEWDDLHERLLEYVFNYEQKVVRALPSFQL